MEQFVPEPEDTQDIVDWALSAGAILHILYNLEADADDAPKDIVDFYKKHFLHILQQLPGPFIEPVIEWADICFDKAVETEEEVEEFVRELDAVKPEDFSPDGRE